MFAQLQKVPANFIMSSICPSIRHLRVSAWLPRDRFTLNLILGTFMKIYQENPKLVKIRQNTVKT